MSKIKNAFIKIDEGLKKRKLRKEQKDYGIKDVEETLYKILNL